MCVCLINWCCFANYLGITLDVDCFSLGMFVCRALINGLANCQYSTVGDTFAFLVPPMLNTLTARVMLHIYSKTSTKITLTHPESTTTSELNGYNEKPVEVILSYEYMLNSTIGVTKPFVLKGLDMFSLTVQLYPSNLKMASFQALPVNEWGQSYFVVTADMYPVVQLISAKDETQLTIHLKIPIGSDISVFRHNDTAYKNGDVIKIELNMFEGYTISSCNQKKVDNTFSLTGSKVEGNYPFGVISGNCLGVVKTTHCDGTPMDDYYRRHDSTVEMLMPTSTYGWSNIVFPVLGRYSDGLVVIVADKDGTMVISSTMQDGAYDEYYLKSAGDHRQIKVSRYPRFLKSNFAILVVLFQTSPCSATDMWEEGGVAMSVIVPIELFYSTYFWRTPEAAPLLVIHYVCIVAKKSNLQEILLDGQALSENRDLNTLDVHGVSDFTTNSLKVFQGDHLAEGGEHKFGCYVYGSALNSYMQVLGYKTKIPCPGNPSISCSLNTGQELEHFNNFTSYSTRPPVSEAICSKKKAPLIQMSALLGILELTTQSSHSTAQPNTALPSMATPLTDHGDWGQWMCSRDCLDQRMTRTRHCLQGKACPNFRVDYKSGQCNDPICPADCVKGKWGQSCTGVCLNCLPDCDKFNGSCNRCQPGYANIAKTCNEECPKFKFGDDCLGDCEEKCGADCVDKQDGTCAADVTLLLYIISILLISMILVIFLCCRKRSKHQALAGLEDLPSGGSKPPPTLNQTSERAHVQKSSTLIN